MVKEGIPFAVVPAIIAAVLGALQLWVFAAVFALITGFMLFFFRDPHRVAPVGEGSIVSAADGRVTRIEQNENGKLVSVFLSPLDVHINRSPITGTITAIAYSVGRKMPATSDQASLVNERNSLVIEGDGLTVTCTQIAGILARRIVCWPKVGDRLLQGQRFGLIKFGSRTDVLMPAGTEITVRIGDRVKGGETVIGKIPNGALEIENQKRHSLANSQFSI
jgi:phosphatidylserine decarboxylase